MNTITMHNECVSLKEKKMDALSHRSRPLKVCANSFVFSLKKSGLDSLNGKKRSKRCNEITLFIATNKSSYSIFDLKLQLKMKRKINIQDKRQTIGKKVRTHEKHVELK